MEQNCTGVGTGGASATLRTECSRADTGLEKAAASEHAVAKDAQISLLAELDSTGSAKKILKAGTTIWQKHQINLHACMVENTMNTMVKAMSARVIVTQA